MRGLSVGKMIVLPRLIVTRVSAANIATIRMMTITTGERYRSRCLVIPVTKYSAACSFGTS
jgi:hypothetical protein